MNQTRRIQERKDAEKAEEKKNALLDILEWLIDIPSKGDSNDFRPFAYLKIYGSSLSSRLFGSETNLYLIVVIYVVMFLTKVLSFLFRDLSFYFLNQWWFSAFQFIMSIIKYPLLSSIFFSKQFLFMNSSVPEDYLSIFLSSFLIIVLMKLLRIVSLRKSSDKRINIIFYDNQY